MTIEDRVRQIADHFNFDMRDAHTRTLAYLFAWQDLATERRATNGVDNTKE